MSTITLLSPVTMATSDLALLDRLAAQNGVTREEWVEAAVHLRLAEERRAQQ